MRAPGLEKLGDYATNHHDAKHQKRVRQPFYLHEENIPIYLPRHYLLRTYVVSCDGALIPYLLGNRHARDYLLSLEPGH